MAVGDGTFLVLVRVGRAAMKFQVKANVRQWPQTWSQSRADQWRVSFAIALCYYMLSRDRDTVTGAEYFRNQIVIRT